MLKKFDELTPHELKGLRDQDGELVFSDGTHRPASKAATKPAAAKPAATSGTVKKRSHDNPMKPHHDVIQPAKKASKGAKSKGVRAASLFQPLIIWPHALRIRG